MENNERRSIWRFFDGSVSISVSMLLFPTAAALYGGFTVFFAAKEAVERRAKEKGRQAERERINKVLAETEAGVVLTPELIKKLAGEDE